MERANRAQLELALVQLARIAQKERGLRLQRQQALRQRQQLAAGRGQRHAVALAVEQLHLALPLQRGNLGGDRGLAHAQRACGGAQAAVVGHGHKGAVAGVAHGAVLRRQQGRRIISRCDLWKLCKPILKPSHDSHMSSLTFHPSHGIPQVRMLKCKGFPPC